MKRLFIFICISFISFSLFAQQYKVPETLNGNWSFYNSQLLRDYDLYKENVPVKVPSIITKNQKGYGTFLRRVYNLKPETKYAILMYESPGTNAAAFVNGKFISSCGTVTTTNNKSGCTKPWIFEVNTDEYGNATIAIQVSNWENSKAGMWSSVYFGTYEKMMHLFYQRSVSSSIAVGMLFFLFIVSIFLFLMNIKHREYLYFSLVSLFLSIRAMTMEFNIFLYMFPSMKFFISKNLEFILIWAAPPVYMLLIDTLYPGTCKCTKKTFFPSILSLASGIIGFCLPYRISTYFEPVYIIFAFLILTETAAHSVINRKVIKQFSSVQSYVLFINMFILIFGVLSGWISFRLGIPLKFSPMPFCLMAFAVLQFLAISERQNKLLKQSIEKSELQKELNAVYHKFIPDEFLEYLNKEDITQVNLGDHIEADMVICFMVIRKEMETEKKFNLYTEFAENAVETVSIHKGFLSKFINDGIMVLFKDPLEAILCCIELKQYANSCGIDDIACGIHYGKMLVGTIGEEKRLDDTVISDTVNTSYRIMQYSSDNENSIICSINLVQKIVNSENQIKFTKLGGIKVKGKKDPVIMYSCEKEEAENGVSQNEE